MSDTNTSDPKDMGRIEFQVPRSVLDDLHKHYPEARGEDWLAVTMAMGVGLDHRRRPD